MCTQSSRLAAVSLAARVADEMDVELEIEMGLAIREEHRGGSVLQYCEGKWLLRRMKKDPLLEDYSVVIVDGIHERTLSISILMGKLKALVTLRDDLEIILMGSRIDVPKWTNYFNKWGLITVTSHYPPAIVYTPQPVLNPVESAVETVTTLLELEKKGNILVYLATQKEVGKRVRRDLKNGGRN